MNNTGGLSLTDKLSTSPATSNEEKLREESIKEFPAHFAEGVLGATVQTRLPNAGGKRQKTMAILQKTTPLIIEALGGVKMLSSTTVKKTLEEIGHPLPFQGANALGDVLGRKGFNLPFAFSHGKRRYAIHYVNSSEEEKVQYQKWIDSLNKADYAKLIIG